MAGSIAEAYVDIRLKDDKFGSDAAKAFKGIEQSGDKAGASIDAAFKEATAGIAAEMSRAASKAEAELKGIEVPKIDASSAFADIGAEASGAASEAGSELQGIEVPKVDAGAAFAGIKGEAKSAASAAESALGDIKVDPPDTSQFEPEGSAAGGAFLGGLTSKIGPGGPIVALGAAAAAALAVGFSGAAEQGVVDSGLQASLGLAPAQAKAAGKITSGVYRDAWGDSLGEVQQVVESTIIDFGQNADTSGLVEGAFGIRDAFGVDAQQAITAAGIAVRNGLAKDGTEALDLFAKTFQKVPPTIRDEITDATIEYSKSFGQLGIGGSEAFGLLTLGAQQGQYGIDKTGDALKEFTIRATDGSTASTEAFKAIGLSAQDMGTALLQGGDVGAAAFDQIVTGIQAIDDPVAQSAAAIALFGTPLEDLGTNNIPAFLSALTGGESALTGFAGTAQQVADDVSGNTAATFESIKRSVKGAISDFTDDKIIPGLVAGFDAVSTAIGPTVETIIGGLGRAVDWVRENWPQISETIGSVFSEAFEFGFGDEIIEAGQRVVDWFRENWPSIQETISGAFRTVVDSNLFQGIIDAGRSVLNWFAENDLADIVRGWVTGIADSVGDSALFAGITTAAETAGTAIQDAFNFVIDSDLFGDIGDQFEIAVAYFQDTSLGDVFEDIGDRAGDAGSAIGDAFSSAVDGVSDAADVVADFADQIGVSDVLENVAEIFSTIGEAAKDAFDGIDFGALEGVADAVGPLLDALSGLPEAFGNIAAVAGVAFGALAVVVGTALAAVTSVISGIVSAVAGPISTIISSIINLGIGMVNAAIQVITGIINTFVGIFTLDFSKIGEGLGQIVAGIGTLLAAIATNAITVAGALITGAINLVILAFTTIGGAILDALSGLAGVVGSALAGVGSAIASFVASGVSAFASFVSSVVSAVAGLPGAVGGAVAGVVGAVGGVIASMASGALDAIGGFISDAASSIGGLVGSAAEALGGIVGAVGGVIGEMASSALEKASGFVTDAASSIGELVTKAPGALSGLAGEVLGKFAEMASSALANAENFIGDVVSKMAGLPGRVLGALGGFASSVAGFIGDKLKAGINTAIDAANALIPDSVGWGPFSIDVPNNPIPRLGADGGIFDQATNMIIGEAGREVLIPLTRPARARQLAEESGLFDVIGRPPPVEGLSPSRSSRRDRATGTTTGAIVQFNGGQVFQDATDVDLVAQRTMLALAAQGAA